MEGVPCENWAQEARSQLADSYSPRDSQGNYHYSCLRTYQSVTGAACRSSVNSAGAQEGYVDCCDHYVYGLDQAELERYETYLVEQGYVRRGEERFDKGSSIYYYDERDGILVDLFCSGEGELWIWVSVEA